MIRTHDYAALFTPTTPAEIKKFTAETRAAGIPWGWSSPLQGVAVSASAAIGIVVLGSVGLSIIFSIASASASSGGFSLQGLIGSAIPILSFAAVAVSSIFLLRSTTRRTWETRMRLSRFAKANGFRYSPMDKEPAYPGSIFTIGHSRQSLNHLSSDGGRFVDLGNYRYVTGSGKNSTTHNWGFLALQLDRRLPHMVLDSTSNNGLFGGGSLPARFTSSQVLSLEGDFNTYFTLYCPKAYERDALYVFTPDLMALLIDEASPFDVEVIDDWLFVYSARPFEATDPAVYQRLFRIVDTVGAKAVSQTERYGDERIGDFAVNIVAPQGQRLKRGVSTANVVVLAAFAVIFLANILITRGV